MKLTTLFIIALILILSGKALKLAYKKLEEWFGQEYVKYGFLSRYYLSSNFTEYSFEEWCRGIVESMGYKNITSISEMLEGGINFVARDKDKTAYISTRLYGLEADEKKNVNDKYRKIGRQELQKFVGALAHDEVTNGIMITTGDFTEEAKSYVKSLPEKYSITLIDGVTLTKYLRELRKKQISARLAGGLIN